MYELLQGIAIFIADCGNARFIALTGYELSFKHDAKFMLLHITFNIYDIASGGCKNGVWDK